MTMTDRIMAAVTAEYGVTRTQLLGSTRGPRQVAWARQVAVHLCHRLQPQLSWSELGRRFGRDRTTVRHAHALVADIRGQGDDLDEKLGRMESELSAAAVRT